MQGHADGLHCRQKHSRKWRRVRIEHDRNRFEAGHNFAQQLHPLCPHARFFGPEAGDVAAGMGQTLYEALGNRIGNGNKRDGNSLGRLSRGDQRWRRIGHKDVGSVPFQQTCQPLLQVFANFRQQLARTERFRHIIVAARRRRCLSISVQRVGGNGGDRNHRPVIPSVNAS